MAETGGGSGVACAAAQGETDDASYDVSGDPFAQVSGVADAVLYEGYLLYPYRRSSAKNRVRWQFGVLLPRDWVEADGPVTPGVSGSADSWYQRTECLVRVRRPGAVVRVRVRYLQMQHKQVHAVGADGRHRPVESLRTGDGTSHLTFDEAVPYEVDLRWPLEDLLRGECSAEVGAPAGEETRELPTGAGRVVRRREEVRARTAVVAEAVAEDVYRLRVRTENTEHAPDAGAARGDALRSALLAAHTLIGGTGLEFVSLIDPPTGLEDQVRGCRNEFTFPVLGGAAQDTGSTGPVVLSSPIILPDRPQVAPESPGDLHDAAEIDEILTLRTMLLTDEEKAEARATDPRAARILDRVDTMPPEVFTRLHGAIRSLTPVTPVATGAPAGRPSWWQEGADDGLSPTSDTVLVDGVPVGGGSRVRLTPRGRGADAQDMFLAGRTAHVAAVFHDVDGSVHLAVTVDDDPAAELHGWYGRFHYFRPDELEPIAPADAPGPPGPGQPPRPQSPRPQRPADRPEEGRFDGRP
ncbi:hypothetical protein J2Z21_000106 [Streptomyces griseochromogenes]|uniref:Uncharacterized protein n=1 Tax=Streptomyces griseochromogenes TaxID=68214 RepID=A0ABS4LIG8_9ACTN|nr:hypothetical protein [Streptomyces griseochromogenes]MBP2047184.1 hypothetical protein [Streptomyces griseochromogenes]